MRAWGLLMLALAGAPAIAQVNGPVPVDPPPSSPRGGGGGVGRGVWGLGISLDLGGKPRQPRAAAWDAADADIEPQVHGQLVAVIAGDDADAARIARAARLTLLDFAPLESIARGMVILAPLPGEDPQAVIARLSRQRGVDWVQPNFRFQSLGGKLPQRFRLLGLTRPAQLRRSGTVAMIDTPIDTANAELRGAQVTPVVHGTSAAPAAHGTAIAALLVGTGEVQGMAQGARLISLAAFDPDTTASGVSQTRYLARALDAAWKLRPDVLNLSFGGSEDRLLAQLVAALDRRGVCMAGAVGNGGPQSAVLFPARHPAVLAVTAADEKLRIYPRAARGPQVAVTGIGAGLLAAVPGGYRQVSGTSFAAATVSGAMMHMAECTAVHDPAAMRRRVAAQARDLGTPGRDPVFGAGVLRLRAGVE